MSRDTRELCPELRHLRACPGHRPLPAPGGAFLVSVGAMLGATTADPGAAARWLARLDPTATARAPGACEEDGQDKEGVSGSHRPEYPARPASV